ncbi:alpha-1-antiproteinase 2-like [Conger conger]|uniref:alpha-1-antiproteinase 2-like n=1 Tax=Conger conger TaxID=82655 RepID=UPI002A5A6A1E|nr:alpha-1-antiproteinase 2-like [Conger conger]
MKMRTLLHLGSLKIYQENLDFAFCLYKHISAQPDSQSKNVFSSLSVSMALAALSVGARGKTHQQLFEGLGFNSTEITTEEVNQAFQHIHHNLNEKTDNTEEAKEQINTYVHEKTKGKISDLVQDVDPLTVMYLINYIYFKGKWEIQFNPKATKDHDFHVDDKTTVSVSMMHKKDDFHVYHDEDIYTHVLQLHYNESVSMMLVLPEKGLQGLEEVVCKNHLQKWIRSVEMKTYSVYVPKLSLKTSYQLKEILSEMGITDIFGDTANLTGISEGGKLVVSKVMHKATLDVDKAGATAAAATGIEIGMLGIPYPSLEPPVLKFDHPFMIFVLSRETRSILFMGKIVNPA